MHLRNIFIYFYRKGIQTPKQYVDESFLPANDNLHSPIVSPDANNNLDDYDNSQHITDTMTSEDLLQPGHVVKERWRVVS